MTIFPREPGISYEYHFFGGIAGVIAAVFWHKADPKLVEPKYDWEYEQYDQNSDVNDQIGDAWQVDDTQTEVVQNDSRRSPPNVDH